MASTKTKAFDVTAKSKANNLGTRFADKLSTITGAPTPTVKDDLLSRMNVDRKNDISEGNSATIDVQPSFVPILMSLIYYASIWYPQIEQKQFGKVTPSTLVAYFLALLYGHLLVCDYYIRSSPSRYASDFVSTPSRLRFLEFLLNLPVPDFLVKFFIALTPTSDPRRTLIDLIPTLAGYSHHHDFGRYFPISIFLHGHDFAARTRQNEDPELLLHRFLQTQLTDNPATYIGNYFGADLVKDNNSVSYTSQLYQAIVSMFNPAVLRSLSQRIVYSRIPQDVIDLSTDQYNPYILLLNTHDEMISEMTTFLESVSTAFSTVSKMSGVLGSQYSGLSGINIMIHGYAPYALPTWHSGSVSVPKDKGKYLELGPTKAAKALNFLQPWKTTSHPTLTYPDDDKNLDKDLYLIHKDDEDNFPSEDIWSTFVAPDDSSPRVRIFDPYNYDPSTFFSPILNGLVIESRELDGFTVPHVNTLSALDDENSQFLQSAIPISHIRYSTSFNGLISHEVIERAIHDSSSQPVSPALYDMTQNWLPRFNKETWDLKVTPLFGFEIKEGFSLFTRAFSKFGFTTKSLDNKTDSTSEPNIAEDHVLLWSPYRYVAPTLGRLKLPRSKPHMDLFHQSIYMLADFRPIYGTNVTLAEVNHFLETIPIN
jgi:hypothetical protein